MGIPTSDRPTAVLVAVQLPEVPDLDHAANLAELRRLVKTLGYDVVATVSQKRSGLARAAVLGEGKLKELAELTGGTGLVPSGATPKRDKARLRRDEAQDDAESDDAEQDEALDAPEVSALPANTPRASVVVVDHELTPSQIRNLERATNAEVFDRTGVIVEIFHRHAKSREARLQVELARLSYTAPRLREAGAGGDRQRGGVGGRGAGESALELDRRKVRDRVAQLRDELAAIQRDNDARRSHRHEQRRVALVGYTNAGKSSLMRGLTMSEVLVEDKLFATLDTTVRALQPETKPRILVSDTVGFIKKLPHDLVASFRSTLDEAREATLLLFVADASDPTFRAQLAVTHEVLAEIGANEVPAWLLLNKVDRLDDAAQAALVTEFPQARLLSAKTPVDVAKLREAIVAHFDQSLIEGELVVPYARQHLVGEVHGAARVLSESYDAEGARFRVLADVAVLARLQSLLVG